MGVLVETMVLSRILRGATRRNQPGFHSMARPVLGGHGISQHRPTDDNRVDDTTWDFTDENYAQLKNLIGKYPPNCQASACIPALDLAQRQSGTDGRGGWLPVAAMNKVAEVLEMPPIRVYEVASFYTMFNREKVGKYLIQICGTTPCQLNGAERVIETIESHLGIKTGGTTSDGLFTTMEVECLGACCNAPMVQINDDFYEDLNEERIKTVLDQLKSGGRDATVIGPQGKRKGCQGPQGNTSLLGDIPPAPCRDFAALKQQIAAEEAAKAKEEAKV